MTKRERIMAAIAGEQMNAEKAYEFYKIYDVDFIKTMNNEMYSIENFCFWYFLCLRMSSYVMTLGCAIRYPLNGGIPGGTYGN